MCGTPVQAIWDYKNLSELAWGVREGQNLPQNGLNLALGLKSIFVTTLFSNFFHFTQPLPSWQPPLK